MKRITGVIAFVWLFACLSQAVTTTVVRGYPRFKALDPDTGAMLVGGKVCTYVTATTTPATTYTTSAGDVANSTCITLDGSGEADIWLDPAVVYRIVLKDSSLAVIWTLDGVNTPAAGVFTTLTASGAITISGGLTVTGTAAFGVITTSSSAKVSLLNADQLDSADWTNPPALGTGTRVPATSFFTNLDISGTTSFGGSATVATGKSFTFTDADSLTIGARIVMTTQTVTFYEFGTEVDAHMWIAPRAGKVVSIKEIHSVVGGAACAVRPRKITDTSAPGAVAGATVKEITTAAFDCTAVVNTTVTGTLSATASDYTFAAGDKISLDMSGTQTGLVGIIVMEWQAQ